MSEDWPPRPAPPEPGTTPRPPRPRTGPQTAGVDPASIPPRPTTGPRAPDAGAAPPPPRARDAAHGAAFEGTPSSAEAPAGGRHGDDEDDGGPSRNVRALGIAVVVVAVFIIIAALVGGARPPGSATFPPVGATVGPAGNATAVTRGDVIRALSAQGLQAEDAVRDYRPAEAPAFAAAPRIRLRAILPDDPDHGLIVIYEFASPVAATAAAEEEARYIASGIGQVQFPNDSRFVIRVVGSTAIFFTWSPPSSPDERTALIEEALQTVGVGIEVPN
jgi:hypothetical protein